MTKYELDRLAAALEEGDLLGSEQADEFVQLITAPSRDSPPRQAVAAEVFDSADRLLALVAETLPSWSLHLSGASATVRDRWTCTIRETGVRDDDELIGVGKARGPARAIAAALLRVMAIRKT